jgi:hypothetical protein
MPRGARTSLAGLVLSLACLALPAGAAGHDAAGTADGHVPEAVEEALGGDVTELENGLYEVDPSRGAPLTTHGPDTRGEILFDHGTSLGVGDPERSPVCATDYYQHVLYAHRAADPNRLDTVRSQIQASIRRINAVLNEEALATGGVNADYKVLCDAAGEIRVDSFQIGSNATDFSSVVSAAKAAGFNDPNVDYTIFLDATPPDYCGVGSLRWDERPDASNANNTGRDYGITQRNCWNGSTPMHENGHNQGAVQQGAPYSTGDGGHCIDENDVMCYSPDGGDLNQSGTISRCTDRLYFDCGHDSYFDVAPDSGDYLATHWNIGSAANRFVAFDSAVPPVDPPPASPPASPATPQPGAAPPSGVSPVTEPAGAAKRLLNRVPLSDVAAGNGGWRLYTFKVPRRTSRLTVTLDCASDCPDQLDLYARARAAPTLTEHDCASAGPGSDETCRVRTPRRGTWQIGVHTAGGAGGTPYEISARRRG